MIYLFVVYLHLPLSCFQIFHSRRNSESGGKRMGWQVCCHFTETGLHWQALSNMTRIITAPLACCVWWPFSNACSIWVFVGITVMTTVPLAQWLERWSYGPLVMGSIPGGSIVTFIRKKAWRWWSPIHGHDLCRMNNKTHLSKRLFLVLGTWKPNMWVVLIWQNINDSFSWAQKATKAHCSASACTVLENLVNNLW